jgi:hypothetical protein
LLVRGVVGLQDDDDIRAREDNDRVRVFAQFPVGLVGDEEGRDEHAERV